jgi:hypothetical protein
MQQMPHPATSRRQASRTARLIAEGALSKLVAKTFAGSSQSAALPKLELALAISVITGIASDPRTGANRFDHRREHDGRHVPDGQLHARTADRG